MNQRFHCKILTLCLSTVIGIYSYAQQVYTLTTTAANTIASRSLIDLPGLTGNPNAIILATPTGNIPANPQPIGAWYYSGKWNIFHTNHSVMPLGLTFKIQYFNAAGPNQFLHLVTQQNLGADGSYIDNPALNGKPNAQFSIFLNHSPDLRTGSWLNPHFAKTGYSTSSGKWYITNVNGQAIQKGAAYNIIITSSGPGIGVGDPIPIDNPGGCKCPASLPPSGQATGDLAGMFPNPMVVKILARPLSNTPPKIGEILKWNGTEWVPSADATSSGTGNSYTAGLGMNITNNEISALSGEPMWNAMKILGRDILTTQPAVGQVLKWGGGAWYPADDIAGAGGSGTESWKTSGANISNSNAGNVGIGNNNPSYQLDINNRIRIRGNGTDAVSAGIWLNNKANTEAAFIGMEDDNHVGFYGLTSGWKFGMNTQTGALKINGSEGTAGQVLQSNGSGSAPSWVSSSGQSSNSVYEFGLTANVLTTGNGTIYELQGLDQDITLTKSSKVFVSIHAAGYNDGCFGCGEAVVEFRLFINDKAGATNSNSINFFQYKGARAPNGSSFDEDTGFRLITLPAGTHNFKMVVRHNIGGNVNVYKDGQSFGTRMTIMVFPQ